MRVSPTQKVVKAWNKFVTKTKGVGAIPTIHLSHLGLGVDYYGSADPEVSLYEYIREKNDLVEDTYADFSPKDWKPLTEFGI